MTRKPTPPKQAAVDADLASVMLRRLGITAPLMEPSDARLYNALVKLWRQRKRPPTLAQLREEAGLADSGTSHVLRKLLAAGRIVRGGRGVYVPVVEEK